MKKKVGYAVLLALGATLLAFVLWQRGWLDRWEFTTWNWRVQMRAQPSAATSSIKLIVLDQNSLDWAADEMGLPWPWPREVYVPIVQFLARGGARAVAFDVLYTESSAFGVEDDVLFGQAITDGPPFVAALFLGEGIGRHTTWPEEIPAPGTTVEGLTDWQQAHPDRVRVQPRATFPVPEIATRATVLADVKGEQDPDGIIRRIPLFRLFDGHVVPTLGTAVYWADSVRREGHAPKTTLREGVFLTGDCEPVPLDTAGYAILRYRGPSGTHDTYTAAQLIQAEMRLQEGGTSPIDPEVFRDAYVLFGFSAPGLLDLRPTPLSPVTPGVEIHATALDNLLAGDFVWTAPAPLVWSVNGILTLVAVLLVLFVGKVWRTVVVVIAFLPLPAVLGWGAYEIARWWPVVAPTVGLTLGVAGAVLLGYALEGRQKMFIKGAFKHYLSPAVIEQIMEHPDRLTLGGERRTLTIFFSDLAGFSSISEKLEPQALTRLLNDYLSDMTDIILEEGGTLDKYEGDAIIAFWNAPLEQPDHAARAVRAAWRCQQKLAERRSAYRARTGVDLYMRIGVNTGDVVVGNMGSRDRFDYTVLGDAANLASRLEGANKAFGTHTMIAESTWQIAEKAFMGREIGRITVVGRSTPVRVFEVLGTKGEPAPPSLTTHEEGVRACERGDWENALHCFEQWTDDPLSATYVRQLETLRAGDAETWDGIWNLTEK